jgi:hypothetical protein
MPGPTRSAAPLRLIAGLLLVVTACGDDPASASTASVDRETFVATYVDLRLSALGTSTGKITDAERERVLAKHETTEEDLLSFAEAHGSDPATMKEVWEDVRLRLQAAAGEDTVTEGEGR